MVVLNCAIGCKGKSVSIKETCIKQGAEDSKSFLIEFSDIFSISDSSNKII